MRYYKEAIFAVGTGRCGTMTFSKHMESIRVPGLMSLHEGHPPGWSPFKKMSNPEATMSNLFQWWPGVPRKKSENMTQWNLLALQERVSLVESRGVLLCESAHYLAHNLEMLADFFPKAKIIHLIRPAVEVVASYCNRGHPKIYTNKGKHLKIGDPTCRMWKSWEDCYPEYPEATSWETGFAWHWERTNEIIDQTDLPLLKVVTSDMKKKETWDRIFSFIGVQARIGDNDLVHNNTRKRFVQEPSPAMLSACKEICIYKMPGETA